MSDLRLVVHQTAPLLGEVERNGLELRERVMDSGERDLLVFPELALTGYSLRSRVQRMAMPLGTDSPVPLPAGSPPVALGLPERGSDELVFNSAILAHDGQILARHRKIYLPTYGLFDEARYFASGSEVPPVVTLPCGWKAGLLICEDLWHPSLLYLLAMQGCEVVSVLAAAPGRGDPGARGVQRPTGLAEAEGEGGGDRPRDRGSLFSSTENWTLLARAAAMQYGMFLVVANRAGVEEGVTFAGESLVVAPDGKVIAKAPQGEPSVLEVTLPRKGLRMARNPYSHLRDESPALLQRGLTRILEGG